MDVRILGIETSCDETAASVVLNGREILSNAVLSQIGEHSRYGGVVPEVASRKHLDAIIPVVYEALNQSGISLGGIDAVAVTYGPGLVGALLVGLSFAKGLARAKNIPLIGVHHVAAHILAASLAENPPEPPFTALVASGGHSSIYHVENYGDFRLIGRTRDDAAGEAFDKVARATGLGYPGGQKLETAASGGNPDFIRFPRTYFKDGSYDFSFSGVKTAAINFLRKELTEFGKTGNGALNSAGDIGAVPGGVFIRDFYASYQAAVVDVLVTNTIAAEREWGTGKIVVAGGVAANGALRARFYEVAEKSGKINGNRLEIFIPPAGLCTDNAAMVAAKAYHDYIAGRFSPLTLNAAPTAAIQGG